MAYIILATFLGKKNVDVIFDFFHFIKVSLIIVFKNVKTPAIAGVLLLRLDLNQ